MLVKNGDVYIVGYEYNDTAMIPKYWENGVGVDLPGIAPKTRASALTFIGNDLYIAGNTAQSGNMGIVYWKNGIMHVLSQGLVHVSVNSVAVLNGDVYIGYTDESQAGKYWKNNTLIPFMDGTSAVSLANIYSYASDIYLLGNVGENAVLYKNDSKILTKNDANFTDVKVMPH